MVSTKAPLMIVSGVIFILLVSVVSLEFFSGPMESMTGAGTAVVASKEKSLPPRTGDSSKSENSRCELILDGYDPTAAVDIQVRDYIIYTTTSSRKVQVFSRDYLTGELEPVSEYNTLISGNLYVDKNNLIYLADGEDGLKVLARRGKSLVLDGQYDTDGSAKDVFVDDEGIIYLTDDIGGLKVFTRDAGSGKLTLDGNYPSSNNARFSSLAVKDDLIYVSHTGTLLILKREKSTGDITLVKRYTDPSFGIGIYDLFVDNNDRIYIGDGNGLKVFDLEKDTFELKLIGTFSSYVMKAYVSEVFVDDAGLIYLAEGIVGTEVLKNAQSSDPILLATSSLPISDDRILRAIYAQNNQVYATSTDGIYIFNLSCASQSSTCSDSDGKDTYTQGYVWGIFRNPFDVPFAYKDICDSPEMLKEYLCKGDIMYSLDVNCSLPSNGILCKEGKCVKGDAQNMLCSDSDGQNFYNKGNVSGTINNITYFYEDVCQSPATLNEYVCTEKGYSSLFHTCNSGMMCDNGACVNSTHPDFCGEAGDAGDDPYDAGTVYGYSSGASYSYKDTCSGDYALIEYYCSNNRYQTHDYFPCPAGKKCATGSDGGLCI